MSFTFIARNWLVLLLLVDDTVSVQAQQNDKNAPIILAEPRKAAHNNPATLAMIAKFEQIPKSRNRVHGPANVTWRVEAEASYSDYILVEGNALAEAAIVGGCNLDLYSYDSNGHLIGKYDDMADRCYIAFYPNRQFPGENH